MTGRTESMPWASGTRKAPPGGRRKRKPTPKQRLKRWAKQKTDHHPNFSLLGMILFGLVAIVCLILGLVAENLLYILASGVSTLGAVATVRTQALANQRKAASTRPAKPKSPPPAQPRPNMPTASTGEQPSKASRKPAGMIKCTRTGKPTGDCDCSTAGHVASPEGLAKYGGSYGDPLGARKKAKTGGGA